MDDAALELIERIASALEDSNTLARQARKDYAEARTEARANHRVAMQHSARLHNILESQSRRNSQRDKLLDVELARIAERDEVQTKILRDVDARTTESHELAMHRVGARAPSTVPEDWTDNDAVA